MSNNNSEEEDIEMPDMTVCNPSDMLLDPIISGSFYNNLVSLPSKECPYTSSFEIKVPILVVFNKIIFVADTVTGLVAEFRDEVHANMRLLLGANKLFRESSTVPVAYGTAKHIDFKKNKGVLHYHCSQCLAKHSTKSEYIYITNIHYKKQLIQHKNIQHTNIQHKHTLYTKL